MPSDSSVIADPASGAAFVAGTRVTMSAAANGAVCFGGCVLRPLTFAERTELVTAASALPAARDRVAAAILGAATVEPGAGATALFEVLAMWLAGAAFDAPDFTATTLLVARAAGWPPHELFNAPAREVDRLAVQLDEERRASEWKSLVFAEAPAETVEAVRARFADRLLRRSLWSAAAELPLSEAEAQLPREGGVRVDRGLKAAALLAHSERGSAGGSRVLKAEALQLDSRSVESVEKAAALLPHSKRGDASGSRVLKAGAVLAKSRSVESVAKAAALLPESRSVGSVETPAGLLPHSKGGSARDERGDVRRDWKAAALLPHSDMGVIASSRVSPSEVEGYGGTGALDFVRGETAFPTARSLDFARDDRAIASHVDDLAATLAALLDDEADLRGVGR